MYLFRGIIRHLQIVHPYLFGSNTDQISIAWEHDEYRWISPGEIKNYETVPRLGDAFDRVTPG
jgi:hypothetical protein